jgi:hypothetical protein
VLTDNLVEYLELSAELASSRILVGDGKVHPDAGWNGTPGEKDYVRSMTVFTAPANPAGAESLRGRHTSWLCDYTVLFTGGGRTNVDNGADIGRNVLAGFESAVTQLEMGDYVWKIADAFFSQLSPVTEDQRTTPSTWLVRDTFTIRLERNRSRQAP